MTWARGLVLVLALGFVIECAQARRGVFSFTLDLLIAVGTVVAVFQETGRS